MERKQGKGRRKIEIKKIDRKSSLQVTFSKRRGGLFSKASELSILCGSEIAIIVSSPSGNNVYSFGSPSVTSVVERFLNHRNTVPPPIAVGDVGIDELNREYVEVMEQLEVEKKRSKSLEEEARQTQDERPWWEAPIHDMGLVELRCLSRSMEEFRNNVAERVNEIMANDVMN
ncbi:agamous-like MADS-box protein AGL62 [Macadamia integrifolia]|uniref:agamous-like MADS-box protein AGL62 n=1 Tax=Macadamia integrifolia TaxID=60698 RepID=UPI001C4FDFB2|nr:agamous-like MADS-box protein AGL62 [Macadamia integrifolia]